MNISFTGNEYFFCRDRLEAAEDYDVDLVSETMTGDIVSDE